MDEETRQKWLKAGSVAAQAREFGRTLVKPGALLLKTAEAIEAKVRELGAEPAFPVNISIGKDAAHDTPRVDDTRVFGDEDVVKLDIGAHVDGHIGDTATTVVLGGQGRDLDQAARAALDAAVKVVAAGVRVSEIGQVIQDTIRSFGARPVANLTGHSLEQWTQHAGLSVPNVPHGHAKLEAGIVIAIEPFATNGAGAIHEAGEGGIYHLHKARPQRLPEARKAMDIITKRYDKLPFASRWLAPEIDARRIPLVVKTLGMSGVIRSYGVLRENADGLVAQAEHTVIVTDDGCEVTTRAP